ncbi:hypothetical protein ACNKHX_05485 [Shigella flexneri]
MFAQVIVHEQRVDTTPNCGKDPALVLGIRH